SAAVLTVNSTGAIPCGGWACRNADGTQAANLLTNDLMEGGVDLLQLGFTGCISSFLPHTRSAQSFTATLKDFALVRFNTCGNPHIVTTVNPASGPVGTTLNDTAVLSGTVGGTGTITFKLYDPDQSTCSGTPRYTDVVTVSGNGSYSTATGNNPGGF